MGLSITSKKQETPEFKRILRRIRQKSKVTEGAKFVENSSPILAVNDQKIASEVENRAVQNKIEVFEQLYAGQRKLSEESKLLKSKNKSRTNIKKKLQNFEKDGGGGVSTPYRGRQKLKPQKTTLDDLWGSGKGVKGDLSKVQ